MWETEEMRLKEQIHQQRQMEEVVEELLQEEHERQEKDEEDVKSGVLPEASTQSSDYLCIIAQQRRMTKRIHGIPY